MVMENPTAQSVGCEFVRQYYTMLNDCPMYLHRFYSENSCFVHGGYSPGKDSQPVFGQQDIHQKILELNFEDCRAKIRQVDSHYTIHNGVVIQVIGELSNNGQPMRRFMQTVVLACQNPQKFYVHNNIFKYLDEVFSDDENDDNIQSDLEEEHLEDGRHSSDIQELSEFYETHQSPPATINGNAHLEEESSSQLPAASSISSVSSIPVTAVPSKLGNEPCIAKLADSRVEDRNDDPASMSKDQDGEEKINANGVRTYANLFKGGNSLPTGSWNLPMPANNSKAEIKEAGTSTNNFTGGGAQPFTRIVSRSKGSLGRGSTRERVSSKPQDEINHFNDTEKKRNGSVTGTHQYPDANQLFIGNLPHHVGEEELKQFFNKFGKVLELRINVKPNKSGANGAKCPNFGFVVFEEVSTVQSVLQSKPIIFGNSLRINVEEKKAKVRPDGRPPMSGNPSGGDVVRQGLGRSPLGGRGGGMGIRGRGGGQTYSNSRGGGGLSRGYNSRR